MQHCAAIPIFKNIQYSTNIHEFMLRLLSFLRRGFLLRKKGYILKKSLGVYEMSDEDFFDPEVIQQVQALQTAINKSNLDPNRATYIGNLSLESPGKDFLIRMEFNDGNKGENLPDCEEGYVRKKINGVWKCVPES